MNLRPGFFRARYISPVLVSLMVLGTSMSAEDTQNWIRYRGNAYDLRSGAFLYSENHNEYWQNGRHAYSIVEYRDRDGRLIASKRINFQANRSAPTFRLEDRRDGYVEGVERNASGLALFTRESEGKELRQTVIQVPDPVVVDGGFDYFVRDNFDALLQGRSIPPNFVVSAKLDYFRFRVIPAGQTEINGRPALKLRLTIDNLLLRPLVASMEISYDIETRRLLRYSGVSNINNDQGHSYQARIDFTYPPEALAHR